MHAALKGIRYYLPERVLTNDELAQLYPDWTAARIEKKLGVVERHLAADNETAADLGVKAAEALFASGLAKPEEIDYILFCTQSPDYFLPTSACLIQHRLGIPSTAGALDFNLGCSGYVYGLGLAKGLIETGQAQRVLLITADTYSKFLHPQDKGVRTLFGDAGAASLIHAVAGESETIGPFITGSDGRGAGNLIVEAGAFRKRKASGEETIAATGAVRSESCLYMNGAELFSFALESVPRLVEELLKKTGRTVEDVDLFVFHQANKYMLDALRLKCAIPADKFYVNMRHVGNTVSSTIPIALNNAIAEGVLHPGGLAMLVGFGVGYSWGGTFVRWTGVPA